ncbi:MAG: hypothetical protein CVU62_13905 [Deltaproteobacteria bacterium HGW-Deltaproteobacteria-2]|jgi:hypothetical protein|nr:MAG: hypothetical protein CVU62_13905 [Deltaproteobacteria bacterium HGW-Deltaproteobacteria-2]
MEGLLSTGEAYKNKALSGFIRESADEQRINQQNKDLAAQEQNQTVSLAASGIGAAASIALMIAAL